MSTSSSNPGCFAAIINLFQVVKYPPDSDDDENLPYRVRDDFLSPAEHSFYLVLKQMMGNYLTICPKVSLADIFFVIRPNENMSAYNRINRKHVDFLICEPKSLRPKFAIELDDESHERPDRMERDQFVDCVFETAGLPLIRIPVRNTYNTAQLGLLFKRALQNIDRIASDEQKKDEIVGSEKSSSQSQPPYCPKCGIQMVLRTVKRGDWVGQKFYGCPNFPRCRQIIAVTR